MKNYLASLHMDLENTLVKLEDANEEKTTGVVGVNATDEAIQRQYSEKR